MAEKNERVVVVTGGSRGIGRAICLAMAGPGTRIFFNYFSPANPEAEEAAAAETIEMVTASGAEAQGICANVAVPAEVSRFFDQIMEAAGRIDVLVNNAGIIRRAPAADFPEADWNDVLRVNLTAPFFLMQAVAKWWLTGGREKSPGDRRLRIVNTASLLSFQGGITVPAYAASKHGIAGVTKALANEWAKERINVNAVAPGYIATENTRPLREDSARNQSILDRIPEGRWGRPEDIAGACVFLASPDADYLNGAILNVDGGWMGR